jgi:hypothetical protein
VLRGAPGFYEVLRGLNGRPIQAAAKGRHSPAFISESAWLANQNSFMATAPAPPRRSHFGGANLHTHQRRLACRPKLVHSRAQPAVALRAMAGNLRLHS